jgi:thiamine-phosphate pyrophosphorylase
LLPDLSPAVERVLAVAGPADPYTLPASALLSPLVSDDEGRPAQLLAAFGIAPDELAAAVGAAAAGGPSAAEALAHASRLTDDPEGTVTTELLFVALVELVPAIRDSASRLGLHAGQLRETVVGPPPAPVALDAVPALGGPTERIDAARVVDANANRAREALRAVEDYCRFVLDDALLSGEAKALRHELAAALDALPPGLLAAARDTLRDVGASLSTDAEGVRHSPAHVALVNLKRVQEALRSLEEYGKCLSPDLGRAAERVRYRAYTLERAVAVGGDARRRLESARLCVLLSGATCAAALDWTIAEAAAGGADVVQLREKSLDDRALLARARQVREWTRAAGVLFIVNDRADIARLAEADGVHLGQDDLPVREARRVLGPDALIGVSTHSVEQVRRAVLDGASYLGIGPAFPSPTKQFDRLAGVEFVAAAAKETALPMFAIGGIGPETVGRAVAAGARRVAVGAAVAAADDPRRAAAVLRAALGS